MTDVLGPDAPEPSSARERLASGLGLSPGATHLDRLLASLPTQCVRVPSWALLPSDRQAAVDIVHERPAPTEPLLASPSAPIGPGPAAFSCECGGAWFRIRAGLTELGMTAGVVALDTSGNVIAYSGVLECAECGVVVRPSLEDDAIEVRTPLRLAQRVQQEKADD